MNEYPLVSVVVVTYNSSKWILETLESIKDQTYKNIELIISDDCSKDDTLAVVEKWINENSKCFRSCRLITSDVNTGVSPNLNRGIRASVGEWIKDLAGDDALLPDAIEKYVDFVVQNPEINICHAKSFIYNDTFEKSNELYYDYSKPNVVRNNNTSARVKFNRLCFSNCIQGNTVFIKRSFYDFIGGYDESMPMVEDLPMWLKITSIGYNIYYLCDYVAKYRIHRDSINYEYSTRYLYSQYFKEGNIIFKKYIKPSGSFSIIFANRYSYYIKRCLSILNLNQSNWLCRLIYYPLMAPYYCVAFFYVK